MKEKIELEKATVFFRADDIVEIRFKDEIEVTLEDSTKQYKLITERFPNQAVCMLIVPGEKNTMTHEVREFANQPQSKAMLKAEAIVVKNLAQRLAGNFLKNFVDKNMKLFKNEEEAIVWLKKEQALNS